MTTEKRRSRSTLESVDIAVVHWSQKGRGLDAVGHEIFQIVPAGCQVSNGHDRWCGVWTLIGLSQSYSSQVQMFSTV